jgi:hypothetical protein
MLVSVVIGQLGARLDILDRLDVYPPILPDRLAVGIAGVVDVTRLATPPGGVDRTLFVDLKQKSMMARHRLIVVPPVLFGQIDNLPGVFYDAPPLANSSGGKNAPALYAGAPNLNERVAV